MVAIPAPSLDLDNEQVVTIPVEANAVKPGKAVCRQTWLRWFTVGVEVNGNRVICASARIGLERVTTREAIARFIAAMNKRPAASTALAPSTRKRQKDTARELVAAEMAR
jgi:hypothetical protein